MTADGYCMEINRARTLTIDPIVLDQSTSINNKRIITGRSNIFYLRVGQTCLASNPKRKTDAGWGAKLSYGRITRRFKLSVGYLHTTYPIYIFHSFPPTGSKQQPRAHKHIWVHVQVEPRPTASYQPSAFSHWWRLHLLCHVWTQSRVMRAAKFPTPLWLK